MTKQSIKLNILKIYSGYHKKLEKTYDDLMLKINELMNRPILKKRVLDESEVIYEIFSDSTTLRKNSILKVIKKSCISIKADLFILLGTSCQINY